MLNKSPFLTALIFLGLIGCASSSFPTVTEIDRIFVQYRAETTGSKKVALMSDLLKRLSRPRDVQDDKVVKYAVSIFVKEYEKTEDEAILIAVDGTRIEGGFANFICGFYSELKKNRKFVQRCQHNPEAMKAIERCVGITFSEADLRGIKASQK